MRAIDSNVLVRYVTQDDAHQFERARRLIEQELDAENPGLVLDVVLVETVWVLRRLYRASREELTDVLKAVLDAPNFVVEDRSAVSGALSSWLSRGGDFADALIVEKAKAAGAVGTLTFDRKAVRVEMELLSGLEDPVLKG